MKVNADTYRALPFWSWNDRLEPERLREQIRQMKEQGIGGFFMHARGGLETPYMGEEWFEAVRVCIETAKELGMQAWAYDENGWPSGFADGRVPVSYTHLVSAAPSRWEFYAGKKSNQKGCHRVSRRFSFARAAHGCSYRRRKYL